MAIAIAARLGGRKPPQFVQALLNQAWADVLTLTALRHGTESEEWREREEATSRIIDITCAASAPADPELAGQIDGALRQVGYHEDEASAIARRLSRSEDDESTSRTELTAKLKARARLGEGDGDELSRLLADYCSPEPDPSQAAALQEARERLCRNLDETERQMILLRLEGHSTAEVARQLGLDANVLRVRLSRLRQRLRERGVLTDWL